MSATIDNPCFECGQCCQRLRVSFYQGEVIHENDQGPIGTVPQDMVTQLTPHLVCMKGTEAGKQLCIALRHDPQSGYRCAIYESRPSPCREFNIFNEDGSLNPLCDKLRKEVGLGAVRDSKVD
jgi:Fe-S-cluster containining protein